MEKGLVSNHSPVVTVHGTLPSRDIRAPGAQYSRSFPNSLPASWWVRSGVCRLSVVVMLAYREGFSRPRQCQFIRIDNVLYIIRSAIVMAGLLCVESGVGIIVFPVVADVVTRKGGSTSL
ncbi:hypothetical protein L3Q67_38455 [Saccharothrix sp. AJ9571]|nr:hypothetical protein L3Q67_38455 [Saccharothrix sp. AJ9571]